MKTRIKAGLWDNMDHALNASKKKLIEDKKVSPKQAQETIIKPHFIVPICVGYTKSKSTDEYKALAEDLTNRKKKNNHFTFTVLFYPNPTNPEAVAEWHEKNKETTELLKGCAMNVDDWRKAYAQEWQEAKDKYNAFLEGKRGTAAKEALNSDVTAYLGRGNNNQLVAKEQAVLIVMDEVIDSILGMILMQKKNEEMISVYLKNEKAEKAALEQVLFFFLHDTRFLNAMGHVLKCVDDLDLKNGSLGKLRYHFEEVLENNDVLHAQTEPVSIQPIKGSSPASLTPTSSPSASPASLSPATSPSTSSPLSSPSLSPPGSPSSPLHTPPGSPRLITPEDIASRIFLKLANAGCDPDFLGAAIASSSFAMFSSYVNTPPKPAPTAAAQPKKTNSTPMSGLLVKARNEWASKQSTNKPLTPVEQSVVNTNTTTPRI